MTTGLELASHGLLSVWSARSPEQQPGRGAGVPCGDPDVGAAADRFRRQSFQGLLGAARLRTDPEDLQRAG